MNELRNIPLASIELSQTESQKARRASFDKAGLEELAASVKADGVVVPIIVRPVYSDSETPVNRRCELIAGERRFLAAQKAKLETVPAIVRDLTDEQVVAVQLIENLQREGLHPMHEAESYHALVHQFKHPIEDVIAQVGKSRSYVYGRMKLLALSKKCRKAFYDGTIGASIAEKLARIPVEKTQDEALAEVSRDDWSYRRAAEIIQDKFTMKLAEAPFRTDVDLAGIGPCGPCPKRTGNAPDLFGDIKSADVCTDTACFSGKVRAHSQQLVEAARARGQAVLTGKAAAKIVPNGVHAAGGRRGTFVDRGFVALDDEEYVGGKYKKVRALVGADVERTLVVDDKTGRSIEVIPRSALPKEFRNGGSTSSGPSAAEKKAQFAKRVTFATYRAVRPKLKPPTLLEIAASLYRRLEHDATKILCKVRDFEPPTHKEQYRGNVKDYAAIGKTIAKLANDELQLFINDCIYVRELMYGESTYRDVGATPKIAELAKAHRVDVAKIRAGLAPKKKPAKKAKR